MFIIGLMSLTHALAYGPTEVNVGQVVTYKNKTGIPYSDIMVIGEEFYPDKGTAIQVTVGAEFQIKWGSEGVGKINFSHKTHTGYGQFTTSSDYLSVNFAPVVVAPPVTYDYTKQVSTGGMSGPATVDPGYVVEYNLSGSCTTFTAELINGIFVSTKTAFNGGRPGIKLQVIWQTPGTGEIRLVQNFNDPNGSIRKVNYTAKVTITTNIKKPVPTLIGASELCANKTYKVSAKTHAYSKFEWKITRNGITTSEFYYCRRN